MAQVLTEDEKARTRRHLGYLQVQSAYTFALGIPLNTQPQYMIEGAMNNLLESAYPAFLQLLCRLDSVLSQMFCGMDMVDIDAIDTIKVNRLRIKEYGQLYLICRDELANMLGIVPNPWDQRLGWFGLAYGAGLNIPVSNG